MRDHYLMKICDQRLLDALYQAPLLDFNYLQLLLIGNFARVTDFDHVF
jgi:hypothetical protein